MAPREVPLTVGVAQLALGILLSVFAAAACADPEGRLALVIGNGAYKISPLQNPVNDARAIAETLKRLDFEVMHHEDIGFRELIEAMRRFSILSNNARVRVLFFAGHGVQI